MIMNPGSDGATKQLDASTGPPADSLSPRPGSGERVREGISKARDKSLERSLLPSAFHEPRGRAGCPQPATGPRRGEDTAPYQLARFMVPMHSIKVVPSFHEPRGRAGCPQPATGPRRGEDTAPNQLAGWG